MVRAVGVEPTRLSEPDFQFRRACQFRHACLEFARAIDVKERAYTALTHRIWTGVIIVEFIEVFGQGIRATGVVLSYTGLF
jgi:hypothetical protein